MEQAVEKETYPTVSPDLGEVRPRPWGGEALREANECPAEQSAQGENQRLIISFFPLGLTHKHQTERSKVWRKYLS